MGTCLELLPPLQDDNGRPNEIHSPGTRYYPPLPMQPLQTRPEADVAYMWRETRLQGLCFGVGICLKLLPPLQSDIRHLVETHPPGRPGPNPATRRQPPHDTHCQQRSYVPGNTTTGITAAPSHRRPMLLPAADSDTTKRRQQVGRTYRRLCRPSYVTLDS
jgi:hypothetical protein